MTHRDQSVSKNLTEFMRAVWAETEPNPLNNRERIYQNQVAIEVSPFGDAIRLQHLRVLTNVRAGHGSRTMQWLCGLADKHGVILRATAKSTDKKRMSSQQLKAWYKRLGFSLTGNDVERLPVSSPTYQRGDYVKVEFPDETTGIGEWMWIRVHRCDEEKKLVFGTLDNEPVNDYGGNVELGSELAVAYSQIREHKKPTEFTKQRPC